MDPLSILASVVGLLTAAGKVSSILTTISSNIKEAPQHVDDMLSEVNDLKISLSALHKFLLGIALAPRRRMALIQLDQLIATLTESVLTFSELEALLTPFAASSEISITKCAKWAWKEETVSRIMQRLQRHKLSLCLMLNIVQWYILCPSSISFHYGTAFSTDIWCSESDLEAEKSGEMLQNLIQRLLESNQDISRRLQNLEDAAESWSITTRCFRNNSGTEMVEEVKEQITTVAAERLSSDEYDRSDVNFQANAFQFAFENDLETSRVYQRTRCYSSDVSFTSSAVRTHAWSVFSGLSLAECSVISAIALPLYSREISNSQWYDFGKSRQVDARRAALPHGPVGDDIVS
jgi:hypothetical protein